MHTFISLFSGCGGMDSGFEEEGFEGIGAYDLDPVVLETYKANLKSPVYRKDLSKTIDSELASKRGVDIVLSGSPCQGFSTMGKRGIDDNRNHLLVRGAEIAIELGCKIYISENVMGSIAGAHKTYWSRVEHLLSGNKYRVQFVTIEGLKLGMAQRRNRVILIAAKDDINLQFNKPNIPHSTLRSILKDLPKELNNEYISFDKQQDFEIAKKIKQGQKLCDVRGGENSVKSWLLPEIFGFVSEEEKGLLEEVSKLRRQIRIRNFGDADPLPIIFLQEQFKDNIHNLISSLIIKGYLKYVDNDKVDLCRTFNGKFRRLNWDEPSYTVDTKFGSPKCFIHPEEDRGMTVRETARIQGFNDCFQFLGSIHQKFKMIGNAVPPTMSKWLAQSIKMSLMNI